MARPNKQGLDYFPFDIDFFSDEKIEAISGEFGLKGEITAIKLLCSIYRNGYFIEWSDLYKMKLLKSLQGINSQLLDEIVNRLVKWGFFDKELFSRSGILTSSGIQKRYFEITRRRKGGENLPYLLVDICTTGVNVNTNIVSVSNNPGCSGISVDNNTQIKVNKSKVNISPNGDVTGEEREKFLEILFFEKMVLYPHRELNKFINHYQARQWRDANGVEIADRLALLRNWEPRKVESNRAFIGIWIDIYSALSQTGGKEILLTDITKIEIEENSVKFHLTKILAKFLEDHITEWTSVFRKYFKNKTLSYKFI